MEAICRTATVSDPPKPPPLDVIVSPTVNADDATVPVNVSLFTVT